MSTPHYFVGIGCKRGSSEKSLHALLQQTLTDCGLAIDQVDSIASIDTKKDEAGLLELAQSLTIPLTFFTAEHLNTFAGEISNPSAAAIDAVGTVSVAEASALALAEMSGGEKAELIGRKQKNADATCAVASAPRYKKHPESIPSPAGRG
jgi:cobalamin biosynthesis protein CbiG